LSTGDVTDADAVQRVVDGADAVISTLGGFRRGTGPVLAPGLRTITQAMDHHGTRRLVVLTGAGVARPGRRNGPRTQINRAILTLMDRTVVADADNALETMAATDLVWMTVCAPSITTDGPDGYLLTEQMPSLLAKVPGQQSPPAWSSWLDSRPQPVRSSVSSKRRLPSRASL